MTIFTKTTPLLAIDIGNTNIVMGVYHDNKWQQHWRITTDPTRMPDEYAVLFSQLLHDADLSFSALQCVVLSSVVPALTEGIYHCFDKRCAVTPILVSCKLKLPIQFKTDNAKIVGSDLIANATAAYTLIKNNVIIVDFGTATTFTAVSDDGEFLGCAISAGLKTSLAALTSKTSQLFQVPLIPPKQSIGRNTEYAMRSGLILGHLSLVEGMIMRFKNEFATDATVIVTGGLATTLQPHTNAFDIVDPWLTLDGLKLIANFN